MPFHAHLLTCSLSVPISGHKLKRSGAWWIWFVTESQLLGTVPGTQGFPNSMALSTHYVLDTALWAVTYLILETLWAGANPGLVRPEAELILGPLRKTHMLKNIK